MPNLDQAKVLEIFQDAGALLKGHFVLSSGLHSRHYFQAARVFLSPERGAALCRALVSQLPDSLRKETVYVVAPALGGMLFGYELARILGCESMFVERNEAGAFALRRGFTCPPGASVLLAEDIITTAGSVRDTISVLRDREANILGVACLIDRSNGTAKLDIPLYALASLEVETFRPDALPADLQTMVAVRPGSHHPTAQEVA